MPEALRLDRGTRRSSAREPNSRAKHNRTGFLLAPTDARSEREADRFAGLPWRASLNRPSRSSLGGHSRLARLEESIVDPAAPQQVAEVVASEGQPLDAATRIAAEGRLGHNFGNVRIHADQRAAASARAIGAVAYSADNHVVLGPEHGTDSAERLSLLTHELFHVALEHPTDTDGRPIVRRAVYMVPRKVDDATSEAARKQIDEAKRLLSQSGMDPQERAALEATVAESERALRSYRATIDSRSLGMDPMMMGTTTSEPISGAIFAIVALLAAAILWTVGSRNAANRTAATALAEALAHLGEMLRRTTERGRVKQPSQEVKASPKVQPKPGQGGTIDVFPPLPEDRPRRKRCEGAFVPPAGGDAIHDAYATSVALKYGNKSYATVNYILSADGVTADYDHYSPDANEFFEAKTRHEILLSMWARNQPLVLARIFEQAHRQVDVLVRCKVANWHLVWFFDDWEVQQAASEYLGGLGIEVRHEPGTGK